MNEKLPLGVRFSIISRAIKKSIDEYLCELDLTAVQFMVLNELIRLEKSCCGTINQKALEGKVNVTHATMTQILKKLEKNGYIHCRPDENDRRSKCVSSSEKAAQLLDSLKLIDCETNEKVCTGMSDEQKRLLDELTEMMVENIFSGCERK